MSKCQNMKLQFMFKIFFSNTLSVLKTHLNLEFTFKHIYSLFYFAYVDRSNAQSPALPFHLCLVVAVTHPFSVSDTSINSR